jgi:hypothetical protein
MYSSDALGPFALDFREPDEDSGDALRIDGLAPLAVHPDPTLISCHRPTITPEPSPFEEATEPLFSP